MRLSQSVRVVDSISAGKKELKGNAETVSRIWKRAQSWGDWAPWMGPTASMVAGRAAGVMKAAMRAATHSSTPAATSKTSANDVGG